MAEAAAVAAFEGLAYDGPLGVDAGGGDFLAHLRREKDLLERADLQWTWLDFGAA